MARGVFRYLDRWDTNLSEFADADAKPMLEDRDRQLEDWLDTAFASVTGPFFVITDYGANIKASDNTAAIQRTINAAGRAGGGVVFFPAGNWYITSTITINYDNITLMGVGPFATTIRNQFNFTVDTSFVFFDCYTSLFHVTNLQVRDNSWFGAGSGAGKSLFRFPQAVVTEPSWSNCVLKSDNAMYLIELQAFTEELQLSGCVLTTTADVPAIKVADGATLVTITNVLQESGALLDAVSVYDPVYAVRISNVVASTARATIPYIKIDSTADRGSDISIENVLVSENNHSAIVVAGIDGIRISDITCPQHNVNVTYSSQVGMSVTDCTNVYLADISIVGRTTTPLTITGCTDVQLRGWRLYTSSSAATYTVATTTGFTAIDPHTHTPTDIYRATSVAYAATVTPNAATTDILNIGALTGNVTLAAPTGTPVDGQTLTIRFLQDGTGGRTTTYNAAYAFGTDITNTDPTAANSKWERTFRWHATDSKWRAIDLVRGF